VVGCLGGWVGRWKFLKVLEGVKPISRIAFSNEKGFWCDNFFVFSGLCELSTEHDACIVLFYIKCMTSKAPTSYN
jgi:hypothetical protein